MNEAILLVLDAVSLEGSHGVDESSPSVPVLDVCHHIIKMKFCCSMEFS